MSAILIFKMAAITVETRSCKKKSSWFVWRFGEKILKIDQQILILSHKISAFSAVLGAIFIYICIYRLLWLMSQNILIFCRQKMSQLLNPLTDFQKFWCIVILKDYSFHLNLQIQLFRCYHFSPEIPNRGLLLSKNVLNDVVQLNICVTNDQRYIPFVVITIRSLPHLWRITGFGL